MEKRDENIFEKTKIVSIISYLINLILLFFPWIVVNNYRFNVFQLAQRMKNSNFEGLFDAVEGSDIETIKTIICIELFLFGLIALFSIFYIVTVLLRKDWKLNIITIGLIMVVLFIHVSGYSILDICTDTILGVAFPGVYFLVSIAELVTIKIMGIWKDAKKEAAISHIKDEREKAEKKERLAFKGRYNKLFYRFIWKNFKKNWKDYILLLICSIVIFTFCVIGFGMHKMLNQNEKYAGIGHVYEGMNAILMNAVIPVGIISVFIIIVLVFYYLRCRSKSYGIFLTLGMRKKTLFYFVAMEFVSLFLITIVIGGIMGTGVLTVFSAKSKQLLGEHIGLSVVGVFTYLKSAGLMILVFLISFMAARDIFVDFSIGKSTDLKATREKLPGKWRKGFLILGIFLCIYSIYEYKQLRNFENVYLLLLFFAGLFLDLHNGITEWLARERKGRNYLKKLMLHNQLYHKSRTNTGYIWAFAIIQFCVLFYFSFQMISVEIAEDEDTLYPYDIVCIADDDDDDIFQELEEKYKIDIQSYPMVRISNYDSTEMLEAGMLQSKPPQGQQIGISESTYHLLKKQLDESYEESPLNLDNEGERIYIVHQQDKSVKAQPIDFWLYTKNPFLHVGKPCEYADVYADGSGFYARTVEGEEIGSLIGTFRQGLRDNLVVFSDTYFTKAQELWKTTDIWTGKQLSEGDEKILDVNIQQGPTKLILINCSSNNAEDIISDLSEFRERHKEDEKYDATVSCCYTKLEAVQSLKTERLMKRVMNFMVIIIFLLAYIRLFGVKMATESEMVSKRAEFLTCIGMRKKERKRLIKREMLNYYYFVPTLIAVICATLYTIAVFCARQYQKTDILRYIRIMIPSWCGGLVSVGIVTACLVMVYVWKSEGKNGKR